MAEQVSTKEIETMSDVFDSSGAVLPDGTSLPLYGGQYHYWHHPRESWLPTLSAMRELGLRVVTTCVPWNEHERGVGRYDFEGALDLGAFLDAVKEAGLYAMVALGPAVGAELNLSGLPERIVSTPDMLARSRRSTVIQYPFPPKFFPLPSFASKKFQEAVGLWFKVIGEIVAPRMMGKGAVLSVSVDPGEGLNLRAGYEADYHPDALAWWREFSGDESPPRNYSEHNSAACIRWVHFKEEYRLRSLAWLQDAVCSAGMNSCGAAMAATRPTESALAGAGRTLRGLVGFAFDDAIFAYDALRERAIFLSSTADLPYADPLPFGSSFYKPVRSEKEERNTALTALAGGVRGFSLQMAVTRARWQSGILDPESRRHRPAEWVKALLSALERVKFHRLRRQTCGIAIIVSRAEMRVASATASIEVLPSSVSELLQLGPSGHSELSTDASARQYPKWLRAVQAALDESQLAYQLVDEECLYLLDKKTKAIVFPTLKRVDGGTWAALHALAANGICIVLGPELPSEDELGQALGADSTPPQGIGMLTADSLTDIEGLSDDLLALTEELEDLWIAPGNSVHCSLFEDEEGCAKAFFVAESGNDAQEVIVNVPNNTILEDAFTGERFESHDGVVSYSHDASDVRFFLVF